MTTTATLMDESTRIAAPDTEPGWPGPDTPVLLRCKLVDGTDPTRLSRYADDWWDLNPAVFEHHKRSISLNFEMIPAALRQDAKLYLWILINLGRTLRGGKDSRLSIQSIGTLFAGHLQFVLQWFAEQGVTSLDQVTHSMLWDFLGAMDANEVPFPQRYKRINEVRRLWRHRDMLPEHLRLPEAPPWGGEDTMELLGRTRGDRVNRTRRINPDTMQMLLAWSLRVVEDFSDDILAAWNEHHLLHSRTPEMRRAFGGEERVRGRHASGALHGKVNAYLEELRRTGGALPGRLGEDGKPEIRWRFLAQVFDCSASLRHTGTARMIEQSGLPIGEHAYLSSPITGQLDGHPWRDMPIEFDDAPKLARLLSTACFVIVSYLSGARVGEVLNLRRGCVSLNKVTGLWLMEGLYFKDAEDESGNKIPEGQIREDPWVILEPVANAIAVLEQLHDSPLLFPNRIAPHLSTPKLSLRRGDARSDQMIPADLMVFVDWVNAECARKDSPDTIPPDPIPLAASRFRRTLAWFIRRRPRGLIAASIQYGHAYARMTEGYAGSYDSGFPDEHAFEDYLFRLDTLAEDEQELAGGERVSGPAANRYRSRVTQATAKFAGRVIVRERRARDLVLQGSASACLRSDRDRVC